MSESGGEPTYPVERQSVRRNIFHMMTSQLVTWALATVSAFIIPRFLGPSTLGELGLANSLWLIVAIFAGLGTSGFLQLEIARNRDVGLALVGPTIVVRVLSFLVCAGILAVYVGLTADSRRFVLIVAILGVSTLLGVCAEALGISFVGLERMSTTALATGATKLIGFVLTIVVLVVGAGVIGVIGVGVLTTAGGFVFLARRFRRVARLSFEGWRPRARHVVRSSRTFLLAGAALVVYRQIDLVVISWVAEKEDLGWYGAADTLAGSLLFPATVVLGVIFPTLGRLHESDPGGLRTLVERTFSLLAILGVPIGLGTILVAPDFAPLLLGDDFRESGTVLAVLGAVVVLTFGTILFGSIALATDRGRMWAAVMFFAALMTVPLDLVLVPWANDRYGNGAIGGALAYVVTEAIQFAIGIWLVARFLINRDVAWRIFRVLAAGGIMFAAGWPLRHELLPIPVVVCSIVYALVIVAFRVLGEEERRMVGDVLARAGIKSGRTA